MSDTCMIQSFVITGRAISNHVGLAPPKCPGTKMASHLINQVIMTVFVEPPLLRPDLIKIPGIINIPL